MLANISYFASSTALIRSFHEIYDLRFQEIVVRVLFILGNLTTKSDETRQNLYFTKASTKYLLTVFQFYFEKNIEVGYLFCLSCTARDSKYCKAL